MSQIIRLQFIAFALATFTLYATALPLNENADLKEDLEKVKNDYLVPFAKLLTKEIPKYMEQLKKIVASPDALQTAIHMFKDIAADKSIRDTFNKEIPKLPKYIEKMKQIMESPDQLQAVVDKLKKLPVEQEIAKYGKEALSQLESTGLLELPEESPKTEAESLPIIVVPIPEKTVLMGADENMPYEEVLDWAMKKLGYADTDKDSYFQDSASDLNDDSVQAIEPRNDIDLENADDSVDSLLLIAPSKPIEAHEELVLV